MSHALTLSLKFLSNQRGVNTFSGEEEWHTFFGELQIAPLYGLELYTSTQVTDYSYNCGNNRLCSVQCHCKVKPVAPSCTKLRTTLQNYVANQRSEIWLTPTERPTDRPSDRPTDQAIEAPSRSLKIARLRQAAIAIITLHAIHFIIKYFLWIAFCSLDFIM